MMQWSTETIILLVLSPFLGSFFALLVVRLPQHEDVVFERSRCRSCKRSLAAVDLIPILSWVTLQGKCRSCGANLSPLYPLVELASIGVVIWAASTVEAEMAPVTILLGWMLLTLAVMDLRDFFLSDWLTLPLLLAGLVAWLWVDPSALWDRVTAAGLGLFLVLLVSWLYRRIRARDGLGLGDAKLMAAAGAWTGLSGIGSVLLIGVGVSAIILLCWRILSIRIAADTAVPLGTGLAVGIWLTWLYGPVSFG